MEEQDGCALHVDRARARGNEVVSYSYEAEKPALFTDEGQRMFLKVRDHVQRLLKTSGAFTAGEAMNGAGGGNSWTRLACVDRLEELGEITCVRRYPDCSTQGQVYVGKE